MPRRRPDYPTSPPQNGRSSHNYHQGGHRRQASQPSYAQPAPDAGPSLQQLNAVHDAPASLEQINALNFPVLQRWVPALQRIVLTTSYCTGYKIIDGNWERMDVEGPLFILDLNQYHPLYELPGMEPKIRSAMGRYAAFVLNRKSVNNLLIPLPKKLENVDTTNSVLISLLMAWGDCYGLSVFDEEGTSTAKESVRVGKQFVDLVKEMAEEEERMKQFANAPPPPPPAPFMGMPQAGSFTPQYGTPIAERPPVSSGFDLMAQLGPMIGALGNSGYNSGYASGDGGYVSGGNVNQPRGRKIDINSLFGPSISK